MRSPILPALIGAAFVGCLRDTPATRAPAPVEARSGGDAPAERAPSYVLADPDSLPKGTALALEAGALGVLIEGARVVARPGEMQVAKDLVDGHLTGVDRIPSFLGGGFLFRTREALYVSDTFDGTLRPLAGLSQNQTLARVSFGPKGVLVRGNDGQRWLIDLPSGALSTSGPPGVAEIAALPDGRAAAFVEGARLFVSTDRGAHWGDVTSSLGGAPATLAVILGDLWITDDNSHSFRVDPAGVLREVDQLPTAPPDRIRPPDPGWHGEESPLAVAVRRGVLIDESTALVAAAGDVARVDLRTGTPHIIAAGRLPPELPCEVMRAGDDTIAVCALPGRPSLVASRIAEGSPRIERTFPVEGPFYASDDGSLVFGGSCDGLVMQGVACARDRQGEWHEHALPSPLDGGAEAGLAGGADAGVVEIDPKTIARWIPRDGAAPLALFEHDKVLGTFDPATLTVSEWKKGDAGYPRELEGGIHHERHHEGIVDRRWTWMEGGALKGWIEGGEPVTISAAGDVQRSAFHYRHSMTSGPRALTGSAQEMFQSTDRGETWTEVAYPPLAGKARNVTPHRCSPVGCDLGVWLRIGWDPSPPRPVAEPASPPHAPPAPRVARTPPRELVCSPVSGERFLQLPSTPQSNEDFGFGVRRVPVSTTVKEETLSYRKRTLSRGLVNPPYGVSINDVERAVRASVHGWGAEFAIPPDPRVQFGGITVLGPTRTAEAFKREIAFLEPFDPEGALRSVSFGLRDVAAAVRASGEPLGQLFASDGPDLDGLVTILPLDPAAASGLAFSMPCDAGQVLGTIWGGTSPRLKLGGIRIDPNPTPMVSAVELSGGETALLLIANDNTAEVDKLDAGGVSLLHHVISLPQQYAPANPDALAVNASGTLAILRTASGADPPSARDPAFLVPLGQGPVVTLAPWSTLTLADDPACRADTASYRAIVQTVAPWVRVRGSTPPKSGVTGAMIARVRWSATRVCLEAIEIPDIGKPTRFSDEIETTIVARFTGKPAAARVGVTYGAEVRQALSCTLLPP